MVCSLCCGSLFASTAYVGFFWWICNMSEEKVRFWCFLTWFCVAFCVPVSWACNLRMSATLASLVRTTSRTFGNRFSTVTFLARRNSTLAQADKMATPQEISSTKMCGGFNRRFKHDSSSVGCPMTFTVFFPPAAETEKVPVGLGELEHECCLGF